MLSLAGGRRRSLHEQAQRKWDRFPAKLLKGKTVGIFGVGTIAVELAPQCKALGMQVVGVSSAARTLPGFDAMHAREEVEQAVRDWGSVGPITPFTPRTKDHIPRSTLTAET